MTAAIYATQSINNIEVAMGKANAKAKTRAFLTNLGTQIFCGNLCPDTNTYASELIGKDFVEMQGRNYGDDKTGISITQQSHYVVMPSHYSTLKHGTELHDFKVETIMIVRGKSWSTKERFLEAVWDQKGRAQKYY